MIKEQSITFDNFLTEKDYSIKEDTEILYLYFYDTTSATEYELIGNNSNKIKINSQNVQAGDVFIALQGSFTHGNKYINHALINGAKYVITNKKYVIAESNFGKNFVAAVSK